MGEGLGIVVVLLALVGVYWLLFRGVLKEKSGTRSLLAQRYSDDSLLESNLFTFLSGITTSAAVLTIFTSFGWTTLSLLAAACLGCFYAFVFRSSVLSRINTRVRATVEGLVGLVAIVPAFIQFSASSLSCRDPREQALAITVMVVLGLVALASVAVNLRFGLNSNGNGTALSGFRGFLAAYAGLEILRFFWTPLGMSWSEIGPEAVWLGGLGGLATIIGLVVVPPTCDSARRARSVRLAAVRREHRRDTVRRSFWRRRHRPDPLRDLLRAGSSAAQATLAAVSLRPTGESRRDTRPGALPTNRQRPVLEASFRFHIQEVQLVFPDELVAHGVVDQACAPVGRVGACPAAQTLDADAVELLADVIQLAVEGRDGPAEPFSRPCTRGDVTEAVLSAEQDRLAEGEQQ